MEFLLGDFFAKVHGDSAEILDGDVVGLFVIVKREHLSDGLLFTGGADSVGHEVEPLFKVNLLVAVLVKVRDHLEDDSVLGVEAQGDHGSLEF